MVETGLSCSFFVIAADGARVTLFGILSVK